MPAEDALRHKVILPREGDRVHALIRLFPHKGGDVVSLLYLRKGIRGLAEAEIGEFVDVLSPPQESGDIHVLHVLVGDHLQALPPILLHFLFAEAGGDDRHPDLAVHPLIDDRTEDDIRLFMCLPLDEAGGLIYLV